MINLFINMIIHPKYIGLCVILVTFYLFTIWFETLHKFCLFGGLINILINISNINSIKKKIHLKSDNDQIESDTHEPTMSAQFINLSKGFKYGLIGYIMTLGIFPYNFYLLVNPEKNFESFKNEAICLYKKLVEQVHN